MNKIDTWSILEAELIRYRDVSSSIRRIFMNYEDECLTLILHIKGSSFEDSQNTFDRLYDIQQQLATAVYKYEYPLSEKLREFSYHFDRDDIYSRKYWYQKFHSGLTWPS